jgi:hypothetical protein
MHNPPANGKQGPIPEEMSHALLTNKKQGKLDYVHSANIFKPTQTPLTARNTLFALYNHWPRPLLRTRIDHACPQNPDPSLETVPLRICM